MATRNAKRERLAILLAAGRSVRAAARISGTPERTAYRWSVADEEFKALVAELRAGMVRRGVDLLSGSMALAAGRLRKLINSRDERVALAAARAGLDLRTKLFETDSID